LVTQRVTAVVIGVDHIEEWRFWIERRDLVAPVDGLLGDQRCVNQYDAFLCMDKTGGTAPIFHINIDAWRKLLSFTQAGDAKSNCTPAPCYLSFSLNFFSFFTHMVLNIIYRSFSVIHFAHPRATSLRSINMGRAYYA